MTEETFQLRHGLYAIFQYSEEDRKPYKPPKGDPPMRCADTNLYADQCPCKKHKNTRTGQLPL